MRFATFFRFCPAIAVILLAACTEKSVQVPAQKAGAGASLSDAASIGTTVPTIVELSDMYVSPETYDLKVTVAEIIRGEKTGEYLKDMDASNETAPPGSEYLLARVRFEYKARGAPGDKPWELSGAQFSAFSESKRPYGNPSIRALQPGLKASLRPGDTSESWLVFVVATTDRKPVMAFNPGGAWFQLY